jgi:hypothetical protein
MLAVLDPALFLLSGTQPLPADEAHHFEVLLDEAVRICRKTRARIPNQDWYWGELQRSLVLPVERVATRRMKLAIDELRRHAGRIEFPAPVQARAWGIKPLFGWDRCPPDWLERMQQVLLGCALSDETLLITRLFEGRNLQIHATGRCTLHEKTRWRLYLHAKGQPPRSIPCVSSARNLAVDWTTRYDERLPASSDGARYPFCPPEGWWRRDVLAFRPHASRPAWVDKQGNAWARPSTGGGYHWDVYLNDPKLIETIGLSQLNIVQFGAPPDEGHSGHIHHVPAKKQARLRNDPGWHC